jgi:hypothetical protein
MTSTKERANGIKLYLSALLLLGVDASPKDTASDEFGCAESVSSIINAVFPGAIQGSISTAELYNQLLNSTAFIKVKDFLPGDIIISPTGAGSGKIPNGHVGILGENQEILSNSSATGLWTNNYTLGSWVDRFRNQGGYPIFIFRKN